MGVPTTIAEIDAGFLSEVLDASVASVEAERIAVGEGFLGELARLTLTYADGAVGPSSVIAKIPTTESGLKPIGLMLDTYEREYRAYAEVTPHLQLRTPGVHYNERERGTDDYCLILEDIGHLDRGDHHAGGTLTQARAAIVAAAGLHGRWWGRVDDLDWVPPIDSPLNMGLQGMCEESFPLVADRLGAAIGLDLLRHLEQFIATCSDMLVAYGENSHTLQHGDFRLDNMFFDGDELVMLDWQLVSRGDGFGDVCPFLASNFDSEFRRQHELDLLRLYHETINGLGAGLVDFDDVLWNYRFNLNFWFAMYCHGAVTAGESNQRGEELMERMVLRGADAVRHHRSWELIGDHSRRLQMLR
jgi:hypothetical protein